MPKNLAVLQILLIPTYLDNWDIYIFNIREQHVYLFFSALMLILFDFSHLLRHFSSLSPGVQVESVLSSA